MDITDYRTFIEIENFKRKWRMESGWSPFGWNGECLSSKEGYRYTSWPVWQDLEPFLMQKHQNISVLVFKSFNWGFDLEFWLIDFELNSPFSISEIMQIINSPSNRQSLFPSQLSNYETCYILSVCSWAKSCIVA